MSIAQKINEARKAVAGFLVPGLVMLAAALRQGSDMGTAVSSAEWIEVAIAALATGGIVYGIKNADSPSQTTSTPQV